MNSYDTELVKTILTKANYSFVPKEDDADIIMLNTCAIRENAHRKVYGRVHAINDKRKKNPPMIGILGCMATNLRTDLFENRKLDIDFIAGPDSYKRLPQLIKEALGETKQKAFDVTLSEYETYSDVYPNQSSTGSKTSASIAVMRGCNNFCTFCVVPYTRGRERSRSVSNVVEEAKQLAGNGFKQVTLLGQNVNSYHHDGQDFADLMAAVAQVDGIERVRFTSPHPKDFPDKFLDVMATHKEICKQIHIPLQSGNDRILELMNRTYTQKEFLDLAAKMKKRVPDVSLSTDVIVGFSSETDEEFADTVKVMKEIEFDAAFMFKYSERKQTIASRKFADDVPDAIKTERIVELNEIQKEIVLRNNEKDVGKTLEVLVENASSRTPGAYFGRTDANKSVVFTGQNHASGDFVNVKITRATPNGLKGEVAL